MFEVLIREAAARFGLADKATPVLQMLLGEMTRSETGGLLGFLEQFKTAGLGPAVQSWLGGGHSAQALSTSQVEQVLGGGGGLLPRMNERLELERDKLAAAIAYLLPAVVGRLTPGGSLPGALPAEVTALAEAGRAVLDAPAPQAAGSGGGLKWWPLAGVALAAVLGVAYCSQKPAQDTPVAATSTAAAQAPQAASAPDGASSAAVASSPVAAAEAGAASGTASGASANTAAAPEDPPAVVAGQDASTGHPMLTVYFASGQSAVPATFAETASALLDYLKTHAEAKAFISGFNDPSGDAALNAELSRQRAQAVQAALQAAGVASERAVLEKPADSTVQDGAAAQARRVEVRVR